MKILVCLDGLGTTCSPQNKQFARSNPAQIEDHHFFLFSYQGIEVLRKEL